MSKDKATRNELGVTLQITLKSSQTYIEPAFDLWTRERHKWNIFTTDPKGGAPRSIVKSYSLAA